MTISGLTQKDDQLVETRRTPFIILENKHLYFLHHVLIFVVGGLYKLFVWHNGKIVFFRNYVTLRGAKIAFAKLFSERPYDESTKALWSSVIKDGDMADFNPPLPLVELSKGLK